MNRILIKKHFHLFVLIFVSLIILVSHTIYTIQTQQYPGNGLTELYGYGKWIL